MVSEPVSPLLDAAEAPAPRASYPAVYKGWVLLLIFLMMASNYIDRTIVRILAQPIKVDFHLTDLQVGLLGGFAYAMLYIVMGVPIAYLSERRSRVGIISLAMAVWSIMTALCGLAGSYLQLLAFRIGVGVGESGAAPPSQSLIADYFPPKQRASAIATHSFGIAAGGLLGSVIGGFAGEAWGWRVALMLVGAPGLVLALLFRLSVKEPARGQTDERPVADGERPNLWRAVRLLFTNPTFLHLAAAAGICNFAIQGIGTFDAAYFVRRFEIPLSQVGLITGMVGGLSTSVGMLSGGLITDWIGRHDRRWYAWLSAIGAAIAGPLYAAAFLQSTWAATAVVMALPGAMLYLFHAPAQAVIHNMSHPRMRATAISLYMVVTATLGLALGPVATGFAADHIAQAVFGAGDFARACPGGGAPHGASAALAQACHAASTRGVQLAMVGVTALFLWGALHFFLAARTLRRDMEQGLGA
jgi:predicted MFS family arabinose efflux permease